MTHEEKQTLARQAGQYWLSGLNKQAQFYFASGYLMALEGMRPKPLTPEI